LVLTATKKQSSSSLGCFFVDGFDATGADTLAFAVDLFALEVDLLDLFGLDLRVTDVEATSRATAANFTIAGHRYSDIKYARSLAIFIIFVK